MMLYRVSIFASALVLLAGVCKSQRLGEWPLASIYTDLSDSCIDALNTTVSGCPEFLGSVSVDNPRLPLHQLQDLCTAECRASLSRSRRVIAEGCSDSDVIEYEEVIWPGMSYSQVSAKIMRY